MAAQKEIKKRGRKPKNEYYSNKQPDNVEIQNEAIIIHLPVSLELCTKDINDKYEQEILASSTKLECYVPNFVNLSMTLQPAQPIIITNISEIPQCTEISHINEHTTSIKEIFDASLLPKELKKESQIKVDICCWWCCHKFTNSPVFMPTSYDSKRELFRVKGCFCSFQCCHAFMNDHFRYKGKKFLLSHMYKAFTKEKGSLGENIKPAPPRETLKMFGGPLNIEEFRESFNTQTLYRIQEYPITYIPTQIKKSKKVPNEKPSQILPLAKINTTQELPNNSLKYILGIKNV